MAQYINIFVVLVNLEFQVTHYYYEGCDNVCVYIYIKFVINLCITSLQKKISIATFLKRGYSS